MQHKPPLIVKSHTADDKFQTIGFKASSVASPVLNSRLSTTPSSHPNPSIRSRHRSVPQRSANVSQIPPAHVETRNPKSPPPTKGAMRRAILPHTSAKADWLLAGLIDRATSHYHPLDGKDDGDDADTRTDTTAPDDDREDLASFTSQQNTALQFSNV